MLGVWLDPKLTWKEHIAHAARKGSAASEAAARLATSTRGPSTRHTRLLYTAIARPTLSYGVQEWGMKADGRPLPQSTLAPLIKIQNKCLRQITGAYKRTPRVLLERETYIQPFTLYAETITNQAAAESQRYPVEEDIARSADAL